MNIKITNRDRDEARRLVELAARGLIDDREIDAPDEDVTPKATRKAGTRPARKRREKAA